MASAKEIPPGGEGKIDVTFKTKGKQGKQTKKVTVTTNDPDNPTVYLTVSAEIVVQFGFSTPRINFGKLKEDPLTSKTLTAIGEELASVSIKSVAVVNKAHENYYDVKVEESGKGAERKLQLIITPTKKIPIGRFFDQLNVMTDLPDAKPILLRVSGERVGPVEAYPRSLLLRKTLQGTITGSILLRSVDKKAFQVLAATCKDPRAIVNIHAVQAADTVKIDASLPDDFHDPVFRSELSLKIDKDGQFDLEVPILLSSPPSRPPLPMPTHPLSTHSNGREKLPGEMPPPPSLPQ